MQRDFKGIWIPKEIWLSKELTLQEKVFLVEINSLDNEEGCFASNSYFSEFFQLSKNRCSEVIKSLEAKKLITIRYIRGEGKKNINKRVIKVVEKPNRGIREIDRPIRKTEEEYSENWEDNNTSFNNTSNNTKDYSSKIKDLLTTFSDVPNFPELNKQYWNVIRETRKTKTVAQSVIYNNMNIWKNYDNTVVQYALKTHISEHRGKKEEYTIGIMRGTTKEQALNRLNRKVVPMKPKSNTDLDWEAL